MARVVDISDWIEQPWLNTGGTRNKKIYLNPQENERYFFKESFKKGNRDFKYEFWSEIIASQVGLNLGFTTLDYCVAINRGAIGCLSKSMIQHEKEELYEGVKYLNAIDPTFVTSNSKPGKKYTLQLIVKALKTFESKTYIQEFLEILVFDALIGNSDRHQENWAFIKIVSSFGSTINEIEAADKDGLFNNLKGIGVWIFRQLAFRHGQLRKQFQTGKLLFNPTLSSAPIYDSGCSFGRELTDDAILDHLKNPILLKNYVDRGKSEVHFNGQKVSHFELVQSLLEDSEFKEMTSEVIRRIVNLWDHNTMKSLIENIDKELVEFGLGKPFPSERKEFAFKMLTLRFEALKALNQAHR